MRLKGPVCNLYVVAVYLPHRGRVMPAQDDTLADLQKVLSNIPPHDCVCLLGDFNEQLQSDIQGVTGHWTGGKGSANADKIIEILRLNNLIAVNTLFQPSNSVHTYMQTKRKGTDTDNDEGEYVGRTVRAKYKGKGVNGIVEAVRQQQGQKVWVVRFEDDFVAQYNKKQLRRMLVHVTTEKEGKQLDYVFVSKRWKSSVYDSKVRWAPAMHRDLHGEKADHGLVETKWKWRITSVKSKPAKDFSKLEPTTDPQGNITASEHLAKFSASVKSKLAELEHDGTATSFYKYICTAIHHAIDTALPDVQKRGGRSQRKVSESTKALYAQRTALKNGTQGQYDALQKRIKEAGINDFQNWVQEHCVEMQAAESVGDTRKIYQSVETLCNKKHRPEPNLTSDGQGNTLGCAEDVAKRWSQFLSEKFAATDAEKQRPAMEPLPCTQGKDGLSEKEVLKGLSRMKSKKATGIDRIPIEVFKQCPICKQLLVELLQLIWLTEEIPTDFAQAKFKMLYKNKGSKDDPTKYRCLGMLNHAYKTLTQCLLARLNKETDGFLAEWQAGFRSQRGCRDNVLVLRTLYDDMIAKGEELYVSFIDYSAAFDTVSHKHIDLALAAAGATDKTRAIFRAIYNAATARTEVEGTDGKKIFSDVFPIRRGVVQGDITSPIYFVLALELILRTHDRHARRGVDFGGQRVHTLGYADDAALIDSDRSVATTRVTDIAQGSREDADMHINVTKTKVMAVCEQDKVTATTGAEAEKVCKLVCRNAGCERVFFNQHGLRCHEGKCKHKDDFVVDKILAARGTMGTSRQFLIRWAGYGSDDDTWEPRANVSPKLIKEFLVQNDLYDHQWPGKRCPHCDLPCKSERGVKIHLHACRYKPEKQNFAGTCADRKVKLNKQMEAQKTKPKVQCEGVTLKNVFLFKYLGSIFAADGGHTHDLNRRVALAMSRCGELRHIIDGDISTKLKLEVYKTAVTSTLTYGSEAWRLDERTIATLNGANARCVSRITGKTNHEEASPHTRTYDLVYAIRLRRFQWLGHILRMPNYRLVKLALRVQHKLNLPGNIFMDVPCEMSFEELEKLASNRDMWRKLAPTPNQAIKRKPRTTNITTRLSKAASDVKIKITNPTTRFHLQTEHEDTTVEAQKAKRYRQ